MARRITAVMKLARAHGRWSVYITDAHKTKDKRKIWSVEGKEIKICVVRSGSPEWEAVMRRKRATMRKKGKKK